MPMYSWSCLNCKAKVDVLRDVELREHPPKAADKECEGECEPADTKHHAWVRVYHSFKVVRGGGWNGSKGNW